MKQNQPPLYPKSSSIYNKILQLLIAVLLMSMALNYWLVIRYQQQQQIQQHADEISQLYLAQAGANAIDYLTKDRAELQSFVDMLSQQPIVKSVHIYKKTGQVIVTTEHSQSIKQTFGITPLSISKNKNDISYVQELHTTNLQGYIRLSLDRTLLTNNLLKSHQQQFQNILLLMLVSGMVGFFITRGINRFSRQGFRPPKIKNNKAL